MCTGTLGWESCSVGEQIKTPFTTTTKLIQYKYLDFVNFDFGDFKEVRMRLVDNN